MYRGWISERTDIEENCGVPSVLNNFPPIVGQDVTSAIIRSLVQSEKSDFFKNSRDLDWTMDVICYGLSMPMAEVEMLKNCVFLYLGWSSVMSENPRNGIPQQILDNKEFYFTKILKHLTNLFIPRESQSTDIQVIFCTQILNCVNGIVHEGNISKSTSEDILRFYLGICGRLLSVPPMQGGLAEQLCEKLINSLIQTWLYVACDHFPSPTLWSTLQEMFLSWRHHPVLITQWNQLMHTMTCKVLDILFGPNYSQMYEQKTTNTESISIPANLSDEITVQCWFRFLHSIGNPVALTKEEELSHNEYFIKYNLTHGGVIDSYPCLKSLPDSFYKAMKGISSLVDMFLGVSVNDNKRTCSISSQGFSRQTWRSSSTGTMHKKYTGETQDASPVSGNRKVSSEQLKKTFDDNYMQQKKFEAISADTNCILHIFGAWICDVCLSGVNIDKVLQAVGNISCGIPLKSLQVGKDAKEKIVSFQPAKKNVFEPGRAQAFITLCNIFCHPKIKGQSILPVYLSRFYVSLAVGLCYGETRAGQVLGSILMTATDIFRLDLQGVQVLVPHFLQALEIVLPVSDGELNLGYDVEIVKLRRSCIQILLSMICLPLHFLKLPIQGLCKEKVANSDVNGNFNKQLTFISLKSRITTLLMKAIEAETNPLNTHMLLGGVMLLIEDNMCVEKKSAEFGFMNPAAAIPSITIDDTESASPKLIHIAKGSKTAPPILPSTTEETEQKTGIGSVGSKEDTLTTQGQFVYLTGLLCHNMMFTSKWRGDLHLSLSSLECLSGLAQLDAKFIDDHAARKAVKWICDYIECQANQPPPSHSKDLHSQIVAAFTCISVWIVNHPWLMENLECLQAVLEVIELGISGCKSKLPTEEKPILKGEKELKPVSFRVRAAAEALLAVMMEHLGFFPTPSGPANVCSMLDETQLLQRDNGEKKINYYAIDGSIIIGLKEDSMSELPGNLPSIISIIRGPTGKKVCIMQMRHFSRANHHFLERYKLCPETPAGMKDIPKNPEISQQHFPDEVNRVEKIKGEESIPDLQSILDEKQQEVQKQMKTLMSNQAAEEKKSQQERADKFQGLSKLDESISEIQPEPKDDYRPARLFLSHMGMLDLHNMERFANQQRSGLQYLDNTNNSLETALKKLDAFSSRTFDTIYVFFVKKGQYEANEILQNKVPTIDNQLFMEFLHSLGWLVDMSKHTGWNGDVNTSWKTNKTEYHQKKMFYYADLMTEVAIHVPALNLNLTSKSLSLTEEDGASTPTEADGKEGGETPTNQQSESDTAEGTSQSTSKPQLEHIFSIDAKRRAHNSSSETKVVVAWLQDMNDAPNFPTLEMVGLCDPGNQSSVSEHSRAPEKEVIVIYVHPLKTGLFHVQMKTAQSFKSSIAGPLVYGMVVSRRVLGAFVRNTAINICRRRRLEIDSYSHPHVCRKIKIQEIIHHHKKEMEVPEFYSSFFTS